MFRAGLGLLTVAVAVAFAVSGCGAPEAASPVDPYSDSRSNIILVMAEDLGPRSPPGRRTVEALHRAHLRRPGTAGLRAGAALRLEDERGR